MPVVGGPGPHGRGPCDRRGFRRYSGGAGGGRVGRRDPIGEELDEQRGRDARWGGLRVARTAALRSDRAVSPKPKLVVAGASGFIGMALCAKLVADYDVTVLTRSRARVQRASDPRVAWRRCDLFAPREVEEALEGFDYAVYLVNNMVPSARLSQARCGDMDVLVADNFGRAAARAGLRQIVHLDLLIPRGDVPAQLRTSREEVARSLGAQGTPVTTLRAGLVVGPGGTLVRLVVDVATRLPFVLLPRWANGRKQPIALPDVIRAIVRAVGDESLYDRSFDLGGPRVLEVRQIMRRASELVDRRRPVLIVPLVPEFLFRWWVRLLSPDTHPDIVRRSVAAMRYDTVARDNELQREIARDAAPARMALDRSPDRSRRVLSASPRQAHRRRDDAELRSQRQVRSIQRLSLPAGRTARWAIEHYFEWLPGFFLHSIRTTVDEHGDVRFVARLPAVDLLRMRRVSERCASDRMVYAIEGGALAQVVASRSARIEFREVLDGAYVMAAIHDYRPTLPWRLYVVTQAVVHLLAMKTYAWHLRRMTARARDGKAASVAGEEARIRPGLGHCVSPRS